MALLKQDRAVMLVRNDISRQPPTIKEKIEEGENIIDQALSFGNGWFGSDHGFEVFPSEEKTPREVHDLLQRLYTAAGYCVHWKTGIYGLTNTIIMCGR